MKEEGEGRKREKAFGRIGFELKGIRGIAILKNRIEQGKRESKKERETKLPDDGFGAEAMNQQEYLQNPSQASPLSFWKTNHIQLPPGMKIVAEDDFSQALLADYTDEPYFKMIHPLERAADCALSAPFEFRTASVEEYANHINACYEWEGVSARELEACKTRAVYDESLWLAIYDAENDRLAASGIAEFDKEIREGSLDWIQVSPEYRRRGLGREIVNALLRRLRGKADFVSVSGRVNHQDRPERLYEACGFRSKAIWHVMRRK